MIKMCVCSDFSGLPHTQKPHCPFKPSFRVEFADHGDSTQFLRPSSHETQIRAYSPQFLALSEHETQIRAYSLQFLVLSEHEIKNRAYSRHYISPS